MGISVSKPTQQIQERPRRIGGDLVKRRSYLEMRKRLYPEEGFQDGSNRFVFLSFYIAFLFVLLTPGILFRFPKGCKKLTVAATHGLLLVVIYYFTSGILLDALGM
jgi:hypothetical protein